MRTTRLLGLTAIVALTTRCASHAQPRDGAQPEGRASSKSDATIEVQGKQQHYSSVEEYIQGHAPGVQVIHSAGGGFSLRVRGMSSPSGINDPLIIIDGSASTQPGARALEGLNPDDIVRIEVLKDAASTAFYGLRGGSGVILVTTRKK